MSENVNPARVLKHFKLSKDPFSRANTREIVFTRRFEGMLDEVQGRAMHGSITVISGNPGCGKTTFLDALLARLDKKKKTCVVRICMPNGKNAKVMTHAYSAIERELKKYGVGPMPQDWESRTEWLRNAVGGVLGERGIVLIVIIDEAHMHTGEFYRDMKLFTELKWHGVYVPVGVVLCGEERLISNLKYNAVNVYKRVKENGIYKFNSFDEEETYRYLRWRARAAGNSNLFTKGAAIAICKNSEDVLDVNNNAWNAMQCAFIMGSGKVQTNHVLSGKSLIELKEDYNLNWSEIAAMTKEIMGDGKGFSYTKVQMLADGSYHLKDDDKLEREFNIVQKAFQKVIETARVQNKRSGEINRKAG